MKRKGSVGFTLIEILMVIGIIVLLAGIIWAVLGPARERARQMVCISNLHQIGEALAMYRSDYDGTDAIKGVPMHDWQLGLPPSGSLGYFFHHYIKNREVLFCPDFYLDPTVEFPNYNPQQTASSYMWNVGPSADFIPDRDKFHNLVEKRGSKLSIVICLLHNNGMSDVGMMREPRWKMKREIVLRLNGQVQNELVPVRSDSSSW